MMDEIQTARRPRRNDIVSDRRDDCFRVAYGRIARIRGDIAEVLFGRDGTVEVPIDDIDVHNEYKGFETWGPPYEIDGVEYRDMTFRRMPTLRRLKQHLQRREGRDVWTKDRRRSQRLPAQTATNRSSART